MFGAGKASAHTVNGFTLSSPDAVYVTSNSTLEQDRVTVQKFVVPGSGLKTVSEIGGYFKSAAASVKFALYTHDGVNNCPGTLVANSDSGAVSFESTTYTKISKAYWTHPVLAGGSTYWIGVMVDRQASMTYIAGFARGGTSTALIGSYDGALWHTAAGLTEDYGLYAVYADADASPDPPLSLHNPYKSTVNSYKGQTHAHTCYSDGVNTPEALAAGYKAAGYDFLFITDHNYLTTLPVVEGLLVMHGVEESFAAGHIISLNPTKVEVRTADDPPQEILDKINNDGGYAIMAHPHLLWSTDKLRALWGYSGIEIKNSLVDSEDRWDWVLETLGRRVWGFAADDCHNVALCIRNWINVFADSLTPSDIMTSLRSGNFYATEGAVITSVSVVNGKVVIETPDASTIEFITSGGLPAHTVRHATSAAYKPLHPNKYVRMRVTRDSDSLRAWSNPIWIQKTLTVTKPGNGAVTSTPSGIDCGERCTAAFPSGEIVTLTATAGDGATFIGWSQGCTGNGNCEVDMTVPNFVTALFSPCAYTISPIDPKTFAPRAGATTIGIKGIGGKGIACGAPTVRASDSSWIKVTPLPWKHNKGRVRVAATANPSPSERAGNVFIGENTFAITQKGATCIIGNFAPPSQSVRVTGGSYTFEVAISPRNCTWTAIADKDWITITSGGGTGTGTVSYTVQADTTSRSRSGAITILGPNGKKKLYNVIQAGK